MSKYRVENLIPPLRLFIDARNKAVKSGFTDNGGAIHSVERILEILSHRVRYPHLRHIDKIKRDPHAEISKAAHRARLRGEPVFIEHVRPIRASAQEVIELVAKGATDEELIAFIKSKYRLVLLTSDEVTKINRQNRSRITRDRIAAAGIELYRSPARPIRRIGRPSSPEPIKAALAKEQAAALERARAPTFTAETKILPTTKVNSAREGTRRAAAFAYLLKHPNGCTYAAYREAGHSVLDLRPPASDALRAS